MSSHVRVRLMGGFGLFGTAGEVPVAESLQRLVAFLALRGPTPRAAVAGTLWPATSDERAMASMRTAVWRLRRVAPELIVQRSGAIALGPGVNVDVVQLWEAGAVDAVGCGVLPELLPGWYDDWVVMERERLRHRCLRILEAAAVTAMDRGRPDTALDRALVAAAADPLRESAHSLVIRALIAEGNVDAARRHFTFVRQLFQAHLGFGPSEQLAALFGWARRPSVIVE